MRQTISDEVLIRLINGSKNSMFRTYVEEAVSIYFRSSQYLASKLIGDCVTLNLLLNDEITPHSADEIIRCVHRQNRAFYTTVEKVFEPIEDRFIGLAKALVEDFDALLTPDMRKVNLIVYVISLDVSEKHKLDRNDVFMRTFSYEELLKGDLPHY